MLILILLQAYMTLFQQKKYTTLIKPIYPSFVTGLSKSSSIKKSIRQFSTKSTNTGARRAPDLDKGRILQENTQKAPHRARCLYFYKFNQRNGKRYVGSSENLSRRFAEYLNVN